MQLIMCSDTKSNLDSIEDFVLDQDQIVTYRWLSKKLNIHANTAKQLLYTFSINCNENLLVTYLVSGSDNDGIKVYLVNQSEVDKVKSNLDTVLFEHVYSVQKVNSTVSSVDLYNADSTAQKSNKNLSSISQRKIEEREFKTVVPDKPAAVSKPVSLTTSSKPVQKEATKPSFFKGKSSDPPKKDKDDGAVSHVPAKDARTVDRNKSPIKSKVVSPTKHNQKKVAQSKGCNIGAMFSKQNAKNAEKKKNEPVVKDTNSEEAPNEIKESKSLKDDVDICEDEEINPKMKINSEKTVLKTPVTSKKAVKSRRSKRKINREDDTPAKRRKRIVLASDSESSSGEEEVDMDVEEEPQPDVGETSTQQIPDSDDDEIIPPTPFGQRAKKRIRKQVDKTFTDEEGFIRTEKEFVYESCSDCDDIAEKDGKETNVIESSKKTETIENSLKDDRVSSKDESNGHKDENLEELKSKEVKSKQTKKSSTSKSNKKSPKETSKAINKQKSITSFFKKQ